MLRPVHICLTVCRLCVVRPHPAFAPTRRQDIAHALNAPDTLGFDEADAVIHLHKSALAADPAQTADLSVPYRPAQGMRILGGQVLKQKYPNGFGTAVATEYDPTHRVFTPRPQPQSALPLYPAPQRGRFFIHVRSCPHWQRSLGSKPAGFGRIQTTHKHQSATSA